VNEPIAIIGIGCRFPGGANSPAAFWKLLLDRVDATSAIPPDRWDVDAYYHPNREVPGKMYARRGGFVDGLELFDAGFFGISPREACRVSPQHRLLLETAWEALEDAGLSVEPLAAKKTGVFIGISNEDYGETRQRDISRIDAYTCTGSALSIAANRISYCFNLHGPSFAVDTACSSSLVATHLACRSIWEEECDVALVGGVNVLLTPERFVGFSKAAMLSPDGRCYAFDARANGYVRAEGAGVVVLKPLAQARADGDRIYAVILATGINQDGRTAGLSLPSAAAQEALLRDVYARAGLAPQAVQYMEMHGTGTPAGDPIEAAAVGKVLGASRAPGDVCRIGSVKTNIGHLESGSGIAGLIKLALALKHGQIPASLHCETPNPSIDFQKLRLQVQGETEAWPEGSGGMAAGGRIAGINSFGFGGTNAHAVLTSLEPASLQTDKLGEESRAYLLPISARSSQALEDLARGYRGRMLADGDVSLRDLCYSASLRRSHHDFRAALVARTSAEMVGQLDAFLAGERRLGVASGQVLAEKQPKLAFLFAGNGPQWWGMGRQLLESEPVFREAVCRCDRALRSYASWSLLEELGRDEASSRLDRTEIAQPALFAIQMGLVALWRSWDIEADAVIGHSVGEVAAAYTAGILSFEDAIRVIFHRSRTQETTAGKGGMAAVEMGEEAIRAALVGDNRLSIAAVNAPTAVTVSGDSDALHDLLRNLEEKGIFSRRLRLNYAFHSRHMDPIEADLRSSLANLQPRTAAIRMVSAVTGKDLAGPECGATYWWDNIRQPVLFATAVERLLDDGYGLFVEVGPHPVLASYVAECAAARDVKAHSCHSLRRKEDDFSTLLGAAGSLYTHGYAIDWDKLHPGGRRFIDLPLYPWQRERHWLEATASSGVSGKQVHPLLGQRVHSAVPHWQVNVDARILTYLTDHRVQGAVLLPATSYLEMGLAAAREMFGEGLAGLADFEIVAPLVLEEARAVSLQFVVESEKSFVIKSSWPGQAEWQLQATGRFLQGAAARGDHVRALEAIRARCPEQISKDDFYRVARLRQYEYGPLFQGIERVWVGRDEALGEVHVPPHLTVEQEQCSFHPAVLDALFQSCIPLFPKRSEADRRTTWMPVRTGRYRFRARPGEVVYSHVRRMKQGSNWILFDISALSEEGEILAEFQSMRAQAIQIQDAGCQPWEKWLYEFQWQPQPLAAAQDSQPAGGDWVVFADADGLGKELCTCLARQGHRVTQVEHGTTFARTEPNHFTVALGSLEDVQRLFDTLQCEGVDPSGIVHCWSLDAAQQNGAAWLEQTQDAGCLSVVHILQALSTCGSRLPRLWLVTRGVQFSPTAPEPSAVSQAPLWGLGRVVMNEHPDLRCTLVDLAAPEEGGARTAFSAVEVKALVEEFFANGAEQEIMLRGGDRYVQRLVRAPRHARGRPKKRAELAEAESFRLEIPQPGMLDSLELRTAARREAGPGEVAIEPYATGVNFKDVLQALGMLSGEALEQGYMGGLSLGLECAGKITHVGEGVADLKIGDEVVAFSRDSFSGEVITRAEFAARKPVRLSFEAAATIPVAFFTAYHALHEVARLRHGERVLIHGAAGGVGLAAIQIVHQAGGTVFATAGNSEKRNYLHALGVRHVMDSRSLAFADEVLERSGGEGVHIVLNSLAGEAMLESIRVLAPLGRFLEIGKRDILQNSKLELRPFEKCLSFHSIDIDQLLLHEPARCAALFRDLLSRFEEGVFQPLPHRVFGIHEVRSAFRFMQESRHIGKIVVSMQGTEATIEPDKPASAKFRGDASYLITGGLGGFGLATAKWLAANGARHLVLAGRSGAATAEAREEVAVLQRSGTEVVVAQVDVTREEQVARLLASMRTSMPPLRGIIHSVLVMDDGILLHLNRERLTRVLAPKVMGAWHLHTLTLDVPLDFFVCFSSLTSMLGIAGQGSYAAANAFLDTLASFRRARGLPGLTINWGPLADVGWLARHPEVGERVMRQGARALSVDTALEVLGRLLTADCSQVGVVDIDWRQWANLSRTEAVSSRLKELAPDPELFWQVESPKGFRATLASADSAERTRLIDERLRTHVAAVLGTSASKLDSNKPITALGLDSLMAVELQVRIQRDVGTTISLMNLLQKQNLTDLSARLAEQLGCKNGSFSPAAHGVPSPQMAPAWEATCNQARA